MIEEVPLSPKRLKNWLHKEKAEMRLRLEVFGNEKIEDALKRMNCPSLEKASVFALALAYGILKSENLRI